LLLMPVRRVGDSIQNAKYCRFNQMVIGYTEEMAQ